MLVAWISKTLRQRIFSDGQDHVEVEVLELAPAPPVCFLANL